IDGRVVPPLSAVFPLERVGEATYEVHHNRHEGKIGVLCAAPREGLGVSDPATRAAMGDRLTIFRRHDRED
ncbi:MAG: crotonyl-CoA carboxylase/reductase, partial [Acidobacteriota bacterium]|nr:crotonyl-CoA carboxylase/reductase [Acidobacteriota bacterium]